MPEPIAVAGTVLAPEPSKAKSAKKGALMVLAVMAGGMLDAILPLVTPDFVTALLAPVVAKYPALRMLSMLIPAAVVGGLSALKNYRKATVRAEAQLS